MNCDDARPRRSGGCRVPRRGDRAWLFFTLLVYLASAGQAPAGAGYRNMDLWLQGYVSSIFRPYGLSNPDLDPLRSRPDFQALSLDVSFPTEVFAY